MDIRQRLAQIVVWGTAATTVLVTPFFSYDPINPARFLVLLVFGLIGLFLILCLKRQYLLAKYRSLLLMAILFFAWSLVALIASEVNITQGLFGVTGRQTGLLSYFALVCLMVSAALVSNTALMKKLMHLLVITGFLSGFYGVFQYLGLDPFDWINPNSPVFGVFGNPNFHASFMGMSAVAAIAMSFGAQLKTKKSIVVIPLIVLTLINIHGSKSQQGYLVLLFGVAIVGFLFLRSKERFARFVPFYTVTAVIGFVAVVLDIFRKSPWDSILYKESIAIRVDFWRAGWKITRDHPIFGVGLDGYRDFYREARSTLVELHPGSNVGNDSGHNVFLDISSGGGLPLLIIYISLVGLTILSAIRVVRRNKGFDVGFAAILGAWVAYLAQSLISINQLGLAVWGWVLMGAIIGYEINTREKDEVLKIKPVYSTVAVGMGLIIGLSVGLPLLVADATFRSTVKAGDVIKIEASVRQWPQSVTRMTLAAQILREGNLPERSIVIAREAVAFNPMNYEAWKELSLQPNATEQERAEALIMMKKLDPFNPNLK